MNDKTGLLLICRRVSGLAVRRDVRAVFDT